MTKSINPDNSIGLIVILLIAVFLTGFSLSVTAYENPVEKEQYKLDKSGADTDAVHTVYTVEELSEYDQSKVEQMSEADKITIENPPENSKLVDSKGDVVSVVKEDGEEVRFYVADTTPLKWSILTAILSGFLAIGTAYLYSTGDDEPTALLGTIVIMSIIWLT